MLRAFFLLIFLGLFLPLQSATVAISPVQRTTVQPAQKHRARPVQHPKDGAGFHIIVFTLASLIFPPLLFVAAAISVNGLSKGKSKWNLLGALTVLLFFLGTAAWITAIVYLFSNVALALLIYEITLGTGILMLLICLFVGTRNTRIIP